MKDPRGRASAGDIGMAAIAAVALYASMTAQPAEAYLFPRLSSGLLALFCAANIVAGYRRRLPPPISLQLFRRIAPGVLILFLYVAFAERAGFYPASSLAAFALALYYAEGRRRWPTALAATALLMTFVYLLFGALLGVQTPEPFWRD